MFRSPSGFKVSIQALAAVLMATMLAVSSGRAQTTRKEGRDTNANRKLRAARQVKETYTHRWEVGGGGGYLRFRSGQYLQKNSEIAFWLDTTYYFNRKLGVTGELRGNYGNAKIGNNTYGISYWPQISEYPFMAGPTYRVFLREKVGVGLFALGGAAIGKFDGDTEGHRATDFGMWPSTNARPAFSVGANVDLNLFPNLAFRIAPNYMGTTFGGALQNNLGVNLGLVYRFGRQK
jgi:hypothetical protein